MKKLRLYLDTSVISNIDASTERGAITREFFRVVEESPEEYEILVSPVCLAEILESPEPKLSRFKTFLEELDYTEIPDSEEAVALSELYVEQGVLGEKHVEDLMHVAYAVIAHCDYVISWNMKHLVHARTITRVNKVNFDNNYQTVFIATPVIITGE